MDQSNIVHMGHVVDLQQQKLNDLAHLNTSNRVLIIDLKQRFEDTLEQLKYLSDENIKRKTKVRQLSEMLLILTATNGGFILCFLWALFFK